jgi:hypothetical protein
MKKEGFRRKTTFKKKKGSRLGSFESPGSLVDRILLGFYTSRSFILPKPVQPPCPGSTNQVDPGLIIMVTMISILKSQSIRITEL